MIRFSLILTCLAVSLMSIGCCGPRGCGPGCGIPMGCSDCDGLGCNRMAGGPLAGLRQMKRSLVCGSGCGEAYIGEWMSTPPDCQDPCCGDQWVGGATPCRPFCWQPGSLIGGLYGGRFCSGAESSAPCGCEEVCDCGECCGDDVYVDDGYFDSEIIIDGGGCSSGGCSAGGCGCASSNARSGTQPKTRMAKAVPATDRMTRSASNRQMIDARANRMRR